MRANRLRKTMSARENFDGLHVCLRRARSSGTTREHSHRIAVRDRRDGLGFEVGSSRCSELRTPNFELRIAPFLHVATVFGTAETLPSIDFFPFSRYRLHHYSDRASTRFVHHCEATIMKNVEMTVEGTTLTIKVDLS